MFFRHFEVVVILSPGDGCGRLNRSPRKVLGNVSPDFFTKQQTLRCEVGWDPLRTINRKLLTYSQGIY